MPVLANCATTTIDHMPVNKCGCASSDRDQSTVNTKGSKAFDGPNSPARAEHEVIEGMTRHEIRVNKITRRKNSLKGKEGPNKNSLLSKETSKERRLEVMRQLGGRFTWSTGLDHAIFA